MDGAWKVAPPGGRGGSLVTDDVDIDVDVALAERSTSYLGAVAPSEMLKLDCAELTVDEQLGLAGALNERLGGRAIAFVKGKEIVLDPVSDPPRADEVVSVVRDFVSRRKDGQHYSVEVTEGSIVVRSADPLARSRERKHPGLPPNLLQCPFCPFVTPYQEMYNVHFRSHGFA